jgi:hypothetical protein
MYIINIQLFSHNMLKIITIIQFALILITNNHYLHYLTGD